jgi:putative ABC transport system ATP-binding protein
MAAVTIHQLVKTFKAQDSVVHALAGVDLTVDEGEMMMLVGPSGCGKTTLISIIAGILGYDSGVCDVLGARFDQMKAKERLDFRAKNIGFIFQAYNLLPSLTIAENVAVPLIINGVERHIAVKKAGELLELVGLGKRLKDKPNSLSGGQQQRVAIARALVHSPRLVVCDEPTSALDHETGGKIMQLLSDLNQKLKTTFVIVTHDNRIFEYAHRIAFMDDGKIMRIDKKS